MNIIEFFKTINVLGLPNDFLTEILWREQGRLIANKNTFFCFRFILFENNTSFPLQE